MQAQGNEDSQWKFILNKVRDYATKRRLEANLSRGKGNGMDVDGIDGGEGEQWNEGYYDEWGNWTEHEPGDIDALGKGKGQDKGKGKGRGFQGQCWIRLGWGHS